MTRYPLEHTLPGALSRKELLLLLGSLRHAHYAFPCLASTASASHYHRLVIIFPLDRVESNREAVRWFFFDCIAYGIDLSDVF